MGKIIQPGENQFAVGVETPEDVAWLQAATRLLPQILPAMLRASPDVQGWGHGLVIGATFNVLRLLRETVTWHELVADLATGGAEGPFCGLRVNPDGPADLPPPEGRNVGSDVWLWKLAEAICAQMSEELSGYFVRQGLLPEGKGNGEDTDNADAPARRAGDDG